MKLAELAKDIYNVNFSTRRELASTFLRFQEYYESPKFRRKMFTLEEYKKWYITNSPGGKKTGRFTYYQDWGGFNIPSSVLRPFYQGKFDPLSLKEKKLLDLFSDKKTRRFYIIGTYGRVGEQLLRHEIAHGLFYINSEYKKETLKILKNVDKNTRVKIKNYLSSSGGYHPEVWIDETHAHIIGNLEELGKAGVDISKIREVNKELNSLLFNYLS
ncbi:ABC transporter ATP-binding protein [Patescibacteria group bacterium]|nr:ABC transporter ATP-binding protein [Patescibacteria group bacterium]